MNPAIGDPASLDRLHDLVVPPPAPWWPPAPGWFWLAAVLGVVAVYGLIRVAIAWQRNRYRREALAQWSEQNARLADARTRVAALAEMAVLLKRVALSVYPRSEVASLTGSAWRDFLGRTAASETFSAPAANLLERAAYGAIADSAVEQGPSSDAALAVREWIVRHRVKERKEGLQR